MKKFLTVALCVCLALIFTVSAMAVSSPVNTVEVKKADAIITESGETISEDTFVSLGADGTATIKANTKYGTFNSWSVYAVKKSDTTVSYVKAKENVDYIVVSGSLKEKTIVVKPINQIVVAGNYGGKITDPALDSSKPGKKPTSPKDGDFDVMYAVVAMLLAAAVLFGAKRQLSK